MSNYWTNYWKQGHITSFGDELPKNYQGKLDSFWKDFFVTRCRPGTTVVDLGTGNGALIALGQKHLNDNSVRFIGIDAANLNVPRELVCDNVRLYEQSAMEDLPLEDSSVEYIVSQFGFEYSDVSRTTVELGRVLKPGGRFTAVLHHASSSIVEPNLLLLQAAKQLQSESGPLSTLRQLINRLAKYGTDSLTTEAARQTLNLSIQRWIQANQHGASGTNFPAFLKSVMAPANDLKQRKAMLKLFASELTGQIERLADLKAAAKNEKELNNLAVLFAEAGFTNILFEPLFEENNRLIGWEFHAVLG